MANKTYLFIRMEPTLHAEVKMLARECDMSAAALARRAIRIGTDVLRKAKLPGAPPKKENADE